LRGTGERIRDSQGARVEGYLNLDVAMGPDVYTFRGPYVRVKKRPLKTQKEPERYRSGSLFF
jgi:hypothetical protein